MIKKIDNDVELVDDGKFRPSSEFENVSLISKSLLLLLILVCAAYVCQESNLQSLFHVSFKHLTATKGMVRFMINTRFLNRPTLNANTRTTVFPQIKTLCLLHTWILPIRHISKPMTFPILSLMFLEKGVSF